MKRGFEVKFHFLNSAVIFGALCSVIYLIILNEQALQSRNTLETSRHLLESELTVVGCGGWFSPFFREKNIKYKEKKLLRKDFPQLAMQTWLVYSLSQSLREVLP